MTQVVRYERNNQREDYRSGHYSRNFTTTSRDVTLKVPKLKGISFETLSSSGTPSRIGATNVYMVGGIRMFMRMKSICAATGAMSLKMR